MRKDVNGVIAKHGVGLYISSTLNFHEVEIHVPIVTIYLIDFDFCLIEFIELFLMQY